MREMGFSDWVRLGSCQSPLGTRARSYGPRRVGQGEILPASIDPKLGEPSCFPPLAIGTGRWRTTASVKTWLIRLRTSLRFRGFTADSCPAMVGVDCRFVGGHPYYRRAGITSRANVCIPGTKSSTVSPK